jgi:DNA-binding NarL/FixJ family response regulator
MFKDAGLAVIEQKLLHALSTGAGNKYMARQMDKSEFDVRSQLNNLFKMVNVDNRNQAAGWYRSVRLGTTRDSPV